MTNPKSQRQQLIQAALMQQPEAMVEHTIRLWDRLAVELISIIGEGGFQSLYARSVHLCRVQSPWILLKHPLQQDTTRFSGLKASFVGREHAETREASICLLNTFIEILAMLIGDPLTDRILRSAWGDDLIDGAAQELSNE